MSDKDKQKLLQSQSVLGAWGVLGGVCVGGTLLFVTLTGLVVWLVRFSVTSQMAILFHTLAGFCSLVPFTRSLVISRSFERVRELRQRVRQAE